MDCIFDQKLPDDQSQLFTSILDMYFSRSCISAEIHFEGQRIEDGVIVLGCEAGPSLCISNLMHEMCHFVEIDDKRMNRPGWGLKYGKFCQIPGFPNTWYEYTTSALIIRELKVFAYQYHFGLELGFYSEEGASEFIANCNKIMKYMPYDALCILATEEDCYKPYSAKYIDRVVDKVVDTEAACRKVLSRFIQDPYYRFERFESEWERKTKLLEESLHHAHTACSRT